MIENAGMASPLVRFRPWLRLWLFVAAAGAGVAGCAHPPPPPVQPWQREYLAKRAMRFDADLLEDHFRQHWWGGA